MKSLVMNAGVRKVRERLVMDLFALNIEEKTAAAHSICSILHVVVAVAARAV